MPLIRLGFYLTSSHTDQLHIWRIWQKTSLIGNKCLNCFSKNYLYVRLITLL